MRRNTRLEARLEKLERTAAPILKKTADAEFWAAFHATLTGERSPEMQAELERRMAEAAPGIPEGFCHPALAALSDAQLARRLKGRFGGF